MKNSDALERYTTDVFSEIRFNSRRRAQAPLLFGDYMCQSLRLTCNLRMRGGRFGNWPNVVRLSHFNKRSTEVNLQVRWVFFFGNTGTQFSMLASGHCLCKQASKDRRCVTLQSCIKNTATTPEPFGGVLNAKAKILCWKPKDAELPQSWLLRRKVREPADVGKGTSARGKPPPSPLFHLALRVRWCYRGIRAPFICALLLRCPLWNGNLCGAKFLARGTILCFRVNYSLRKIKFCQ